MMWSLFLSTSVLADECSERAECSVCTAGERYAGVIGECVHYEGQGCMGWMEAYAMFSSATYPFMTFQPEDCPPEVDPAAFFAMLQAITDEPTPQPTPEPTKEPTRNPTLSPTDQPTPEPVAIALASTDVTFASDTEAVAIPESCAARTEYGCETCIHGVSTYSNAAHFDCVFYEPFAGGGECIDGSGMWDKLDEVGYGEIKKMAMTQCPPSGIRAVSDRKMQRSTHRDHLGSRGLQPLGRDLNKDEMAEDFVCSMKAGGCEECIAHETDQFQALRDLSACVYYAPTGSCRSFRGAMDLFAGHNIEEFAFTQCPASGVRSIRGNDRMERVAKDFASMMWSSSRGASSVGRLLGDNHRERAAKTLQERGLW